MDGEEFDNTILQAPTPSDRLAWFGALLATEAGTLVEVVGESAIEIYLTSELYVSQDVDIVGDRRSLAAVLDKWGFRRLEGRSRRVYWFKKSVGLVDLVGSVSRSGLPPQLLTTPFGRVRVSAIEPLIIRRLMRSAREDSVALFDQAIMLGRLGALDWEYLEAESKYEKLGPILQRFKQEIAMKKPRPPRRSKTTRNPSQK